MITTLAAKVQRALQPAFSRDLNPFSSIMQMHGHVYPVKKDIPQRFIVSAQPFSLNVAQDRRSPPKKPGVKLYARLINEFSSARVSLEGDAFMMNTSCIHN